MTTDAPKPGIYHDVPFVEYQSWPAMNSSTLKHGLQSMRSLRYAEIGEDRQDSQSMMLGRLTHTAILEPGKLLSEFAIYNGRRAGKKYQEFCEQNSGKTIIKPGEHDAAMAMRRNVAQHNDDTATLIAAAKHFEVSIVWEDNGVLCKSRIDIVGDGWIADLKTAQSIMPHMVSKSISTYSYWFQFAMYRRGWMQVTGEDVNFTSIWAQNSQPYDCCRYDWDSEDLDRWELAVANLLQQYSHAKQHNQWPFSVSGEAPVPAWLRSTEE